MTDAWQRDPLLDGFAVTGGETDAAYGPRAVAGWPIRAAGEPDVEAAPVLLDRALALLSDAMRDGYLPVERAGDVINARLLATAAAMTMTPVRAWACYTTFAAGWGVLLGGRRIVWSSHFTEQDAELWLDAWKAHFADRGDYEWHLEEIPVDVGTLRRPGAEPRMPAR